MKDVLGPLIPTKFLYIKYILNFKLTVVKRSNQLYSYRPAQMSFPIRLLYATSSVQKQSGNETEHPGSTSSFEPWKL